MLARYGGEEFVLLLPQEAPTALNVVAQRMLDTIRRLKIPHAGSPTAPYVTASWACTPCCRRSNTATRALIRPGRQQCIAPSRRPQPARFAGPYPELLEKVRS
jgi:GGDEF domain-containing protein